MIFGFLKKVQESVVNERTTDHAGTYSEADQSALMATYEDAVLICESLQANMVRASVASMQLFGESAGEPSEELYIASLFDKAKGLFVSIWKVIVDAFKAVTNWIKGLFGKVTKATSKNIEQIDKLSKLTAIKLSEMGEYGKNWTIPANHKFEHKVMGPVLSAIVVAYGLWSKGKFGTLKLNSTHTADGIFKETIQKNITDAIVALVGNEDKIDDAKSNAIAAAGKTVDGVVNDLRSNNLSGLSGEGSERKAKQLKFFICGLLFNKPDQFFDTKEWENRGAKGAQGSVEDFKALAEIFDKAENNEVILGGNILSSERTALIAKVIKEFQDTTKTTLNSAEFINGGGKAGDDRLLSNIIEYIIGNFKAQAGIFMNIPEDSGDVKAYLMKSIFEDRLPKTISKDNNFGGYVKEMAATIAGSGAWVSVNSIQSIKNNLGEGEKFFSNIAKEYQSIYDQMKKVIDSNTGISSKPKLSGITSSLNSMVKSTGELTSWFTTGIIQMYAIGDMLLSRGLAEVLTNINQFNNILEKVAIKVE